jgi:hypothetical protein
MLNKDPASRITVVQVSMLPDPTHTYTHTHTHAHAHTHTHIHTHTHPHTHTHTHIHTHARTHALHEYSYINSGANNTLMKPFTFFSGT